MKQAADSRLFILLVFAALILCSGWYFAAPEADGGSSYFWADGRLIRSKNGRTGTGIRLASGMACADIPPELAAFFNLPLPVNRAGQAALMRLPGIGPKLAENIITCRKGQGRLSLPDDLVKIKGIGPKRSSRLLPLLCFDNAQ